MTKREKKAAEARHERQCNDVKAQRAPTAAEAAAIAAAKETAAKRPARVELRTEIHEQTAQALPRHSDHHGWSLHMQAALGSSSEAFVGALMTQLDPLIRQGPRDTNASDSRTNYALALMEGIAPENELQAAIGAQIVATHAVSLDYLARSRQAESLEVSQAYANMATKLSRTMAVHAETLGKLRSGGKQRIEVVHVYGPAVIGDGAQAVFGGIGGAEGGKFGQPHALQPPMRGEDAIRLPLPLALDQGEAPLSPTWGPESGGSEGDA